MAWMFPHSYNADPIPGLWDTNATFTRRTPLQLILLNLDTPAQSGRSFGKPSNRNPAFGQKIFDIPVAGIKSIVEPDGVGKDIGWGRLAGFGDAYKYSFADSINIGDLTWQYRG